ncbi:1-(5-phosphoribosyl)-5-[(5-phosphoribosylamino)methylideneamino] imidazole-4-carboxamide isomerase [Natronincola peptidivorans]|uniref:1-(5-phosphoribosyl)-5-[(5-phosphoribosylamino)methylideneamino] imidazole-4-carboxamide isomerase n=1 Tax=Natronincola peptidivorans TaxID=426128 RepID=A0A1H9ZK66_9FIRM|nr:1-(5-phosphoribosyl)-5-[(5-phosphoribosylamino)methylideneamino]imidazole-4-carboxamide isomerase [Natronincola peptidivorans]SES81914.1 1-(5-phosphoribosyl)-5-[(5-phosphoribosylamino)methylideneamino] imidazole-4-carboxamide isomerase [Natronincola peptidivorans]
MMIYPAIDIKDGRCVRLTQGKFDEEKIYFNDPQEVAKLWQEKGAEVLHIVDLDGALEGKGKNLSIIQAIVDAVNIPVQVGGGIRSIEAIEQLMAIGVERVILGTKAIEDKEMLKKAIAGFGSRVVVSIDAKDGYVAVDGWTKTSSVAALDFAKELEEMGIKTIIYTDIARDGMLQGPNFKAISQLKQQVGIDIIASGGVATIEDLQLLSHIGVAGAIVGKALYEGKIDLSAVKGEMKND